MSRKEKTYHFIYKTTDTRNGNFYVGMHSTDNLNDGYIGSGTRLRRLIYKHGKEIFNMEILEFLPDRSSLKQKEIEIINEDFLFDSKCLNLVVGGTGGFISLEGTKKGAKTTNEKYKHKKSEWCTKGGKTTIETYGSLFKDVTNRYNWEGKKHSEVSKQKIGFKSKIHQTGKGNSQFGTMWITNEIENKKINKEDIIPNGWKKGRI